MIEVRAAGGIAKKHSAELMGESFAQFVRLEEVEIKDEESGPFWYITLSIPEQRPGSVTFALTAGGAGRDYKVRKIDASTGDVKSMKIRRFNGE